MGSKLEYRIAIYAAVGLHVYKPLQSLGIDVIRYKNG